MHRLGFPTRARESRQDGFRGARVARRVGRVRPRLWQGQLTERELAVANPSAQRRRSHIDRGAVGIACMNQERPFRMRKWDHARTENLRKEPRDAYRLELVRHVHVAENLDELTRPVFEAPSSLEMLEATIGAVVRIEARVPDLRLVLSTAALTDAGAAAAWHDRLQIKRGALQRALEGVDSDGRFNSAWTIAEAVDILAAHISVGTYPARPRRRAGVAARRLIAKVWSVCQRSLLVAPACPRQKSKPPQKPLHR